MTAEWDPLGGHCVFAQRLPDVAAVSTLSILCQRPSFKEHLRPKPLIASRSRLIEFRRLLGSPVR